MIESEEICFASSEISRCNFADEIGKLAGEKNVRFKLSRLRKIYFREVSTLTEAEFNKFLNDIKIEKSSE